MVERGRVELDGTPQHSIPAFSYHIEYTSVGGVNSGQPPTSSHPQNAREVPTLGYHLHAGHSRHSVQQNITSTVFHLNCLCFLHTYSLQCPAGVCSCAGTSENKKIK
ncbi:hypothetical protein E2C01_079222 [Portunus trituberculatus]|uniref:Uncharacterized protein n=1 Tax=Portunus trituberculatus TaxID=210409 RepID=A0A5B7IQ16_PORTR|nr:hypothetical protein [Portunus trituberculatus]